MAQMPYTTSMARSTAPGVGRRARMRGQLSTTFRWCTTGLAWCATNVTTTCQPHQTPSTATAGRTANPLEREAPTSQSYPDNCQQGTYELSLSPLGILIEESRVFSFPWAALLGTPPPISTTLEENQMEKAPPTNPQCPVTWFPTCLDQAAAANLVCQQCWTL